MIFVQVAEIVSCSDVSPFEIIHSGLVDALLNYLTDADMQTARHEQRQPQTIEKIHTQAQTWNKGRHKHVDTDTDTPQTHLQPFGIN